MSTLIELSLNSINHNISNPPSYCLEELDNRLYNEISYYELPNKFENKFLLSDNRAILMMYLPKNKTQLYYFKKSFNTNQIQTYNLNGYFEMTQYHYFV